MREVYEVVQHDGGWAYKVKDVFSEPFATQDAAREAAEAATERQQLAGETTDIEYQDAAGRLHREHADANERPETAVKVTDLGGADAVLRGEAEDELEAEAILREAGGEEADEDDDDEDDDGVDDEDDDDKR